MAFSPTTGLLAVSEGAHQSLALNAWMNGTTGEVRFYAPGGQPLAVTTAWQNLGLCAVLQVAQMVGGPQDGLGSPQAPAEG